MRVDKELQTAFVIALFLHIAIFFIFDLKIFSPTKFSLKKTEIYFWSFVLSKDNEKREFEEGQTPLFLKNKFDSIIKEREIPSKNNLLLAKQSLYIIPEKPKIEESRGVRVIEKEYFSLPDFSNKRTISLPPMLKEITSLNFNSLFPKDEEDFNFKLRFYVSENGVVNFVEPLVFSGNPELDISVIKTIKILTFIPENNSEKCYEIEFSPRYAEVR